MFQYFYHAIETGLKDNKISEREMDRGDQMNNKLIIIFVLVGLLLILIIQNTQNISLNIFFWNIMMPQVILVLILFTLGFVIGFLLAKIKGSK